MIPVDDRESLPRRGCEHLLEFLVALGGKSNLTKGKHNNGNSFAAAAGAKILILYYQDCLKSPMSIQQGKK